MKEWTKMITESTLTILVESSISIDTPKLKPGIYTVSWLALSRDDGHITKGSYVFTVSNASNRFGDWCKRDD